MYDSHQFTVYVNTSNEREFPSDPHCEIVMYTEQAKHHAFLIPSSHEKQLEILLLHSNTWNGNRLDVSAKK